MPDNSFAAVQNVDKLTIDNAQYHGIVNKLDDNRKNGTRKQWTDTSMMPSPLKILKLGDIIPAGELAEKFDQGMVTTLQSHDSTKLDEMTDVVLQTSRAIKQARRNYSIWRPTEQAGFEYLAAVKTDSKDSTQLKQYRDFYNNRPLSLCLDQRHFPDQRYFNKQGRIKEEARDLPALGRLSSEYCIAPEPLPLDHPTSPDLFDKLFEDVRRANDPSYRPFAVVTCFWEDVRNQLWLENSPILEALEARGIGLGIEFPDLEKKRSGSSRLELKKSPTLPDKCFGDPLLLQQLRDDLVKRKRSERTGRELRVQSFKPTPSPLKGVFQQE